MYIIAYGWLRTFNNLLHCPGFNIIMGNYDEIHGHERNALLSQEYTSRFKGYCICIYARGKDAAGNLPSWP